MDIIVSLIFFIATCNANFINGTEYDKMPPLFKLDQYDSCLRKEGIYCMLQLDLKSDAPNDLTKFIQEYSENSATHFNYTYLSRGVCVPTTCRKFISGKSTGTQLHSILDTCLNESIWEEYGIEYKLSTIFYCDKNNEKIEYDSYDWLVMAIAVIILILNVTGTSYDLFIRKQKRELMAGMEKNYLLCFSIVRNWKGLFNTECQEKRMEQLKGLHCLNKATYMPGEDFSSEQEDVARQFFIKVSQTFVCNLFRFGFNTERCILTFLVVMAHASWVNMTFIDNPLDFEMAYDTFYYRVIHGGMMLVQIFFVLSGFHLVYNLLLLEESTKVTWRMYPWVIVQRFFRLTPVNAVMLAFIATWLRHLGTGPLWKLLVSDSVVAQCREHWWKHIFYFNNYVYEDRFCAPQTWFLAANFQLFLLGVGIFILARMRNKNKLMLVLLFVGLLVPALQVWLNNLDGVVIMRPEFFRTHINDTYWILHIRAHNNLSLYVVGMWTGYTVYELKKKETKFLYTNMLRYFTWLVIPVVVCLFASCSLFYTETDRVPIIIRMAFASLQRMVIAGISAFSIFALIFRFNGTISNIFEWPGWVVPSRLSYSVYLVHLIFIQIHLGLMTQLSHMSMYYFLVIVLGMTSLSLISSLPLYLMVEAPFSKFMKELDAKKSDVSAKGVRNDIRRRKERYDNTGPVNLSKS